MNDPQITPMSTTIPVSDEARLRMMLRACSEPPCAAGPWNRDMTKAPRDGTPLLLRHRIAGVLCARFSPAGTRHGYDAWQCSCSYANWVAFRDDEYLDGWARINELEEPT